MDAKAFKAQLQEIQPLRALFLQEANFQVRYNACHERGWTDSYLLTIDDVEIGYGSIKGQEIKDRDTVFEFYVIPVFRKFASCAFAELLAASGARYVECQTNDLLMCQMLYEFSRNVRADTVLFADRAVTEHTVAGALVRLRRKDDQIFEHQVEPAGDYVLELGAEIVATGGFMTHYNAPFADLYMEVRADRRGLGYATFILQEVKKACYLAGHVPAARCSLTNKASQRALIKAGMQVCGFMLLGHVNVARQSTPAGSL